MDAANNKKLQITNSAAKRVMEIQSKNPNQVLKVKIVKGGCAGMKYELMLSGILKEDEIIHHSGIPCISIQKDQVVFLENCIIDFKKTLMKGQFTIKNNNTSITCNCGTSFKL